MTETNKTGTEYSPAGRALDMAERVGHLLYRLPELERGKIEKIVVPNDLKKAVMVILNQNPLKKIFLKGDTLYYSEHPIVGELRGLVEVLSERVNLCDGVVTIKMSPRGNCDDAEIAINPTENTIVLRSEGTEMRDADDDGDEYIILNPSSEERYKVKYCDDLAYIKEVDDNE